MFKYVCWCGYEGLKKLEMIFENHEVPYRVTDLEGGLYRVNAEVSIFKILKVSRILKKEGLLN